MPYGFAHQNGLAERAVRSLRTAVKITTGDSRIQPNQVVLKHMRQMARNRVPHSATGLHPSLEMAGRCDILAVRSETARNHDQAIADPAARQAKAPRNLPNARNAAIAADANKAWVDCVLRNVPGPARIRIPVSASVQIEKGGRRRGTYRAVAHASPNLILERGRTLIKCPRAKSRLYPGTEEDEVQYAPTKRPRAAEISDEDPTQEEPIRRESRKSDAPLGSEDALTRKTEKWDMNYTTNLARK